MTTAIKENDSNLPQFVAFFYWGSTDYISLPYHITLVRSSRSNHFVNFTGKHLFGSLLLITLLWAFRCFSDIFRGCRRRRSGFFIVNFEHISTFSSVSVDYQVSFPPAYCPKNNNLILRITTSVKPLYSGLVSTFSRKRMNYSQTFISKPLSSGHLCFVDRFFEFGIKNILDRSLRSGQCEKG